MEFKEKEDPKGQPEEIDPFNKANEEPEDTGQPTEDDLEAYFGDPDGGDNPTDHGTPRPTEDPEADPEDGEPAAAEEPAEEPEADPVEDPEADPGEPQEEPPAEEEKYKIKVQGEEIEVTKEELIEFAQKGKDYTQKTQALAEREKRITGYEGLVNLVDRDPNFRQHVQQYDPNRAASPTPEAEPAPDPFAVDIGEMPEDPVERVKWEAKKEVLEQIQPVVEAVRGEVASVRKEISNVAPQVKRDVDPYGEATQLALHTYLKGLPEHSARILYNQWDQDANAYQEAFAWMREKVVEQAELMSSEDPANPTDSPPSGGEPVKKKPKPKGKVERKVTERAPVLESAGAAPVEATGADKAKKVKMLHSRIKNQEFDHRDVGALFDLIDPLD